MAAASPMVVFGLDGQPKKHCHSYIQDVQVSQCPGALFRCLLLDRVSAEILMLHGISSRATLDGIIGEHLC